MSFDLLTERKAVKIIQNLSRYYEHLAAREFEKSISRDRHTIVYTCARAPEHLAMAVSEAFAVQSKASAILNDLIPILESIMPDDPDANPGENTPDWGYDLYDSLSSDDSGFDA